MRRPGKQVAGRSLSRSSRHVDGPKVAKRTSKAKTTVLTENRSNSLQATTVVVTTRSGGGGGGGAASGAAGGQPSLMQRCGLCSLLSRLLRRAMCVGSRRGSGESYYQELDTTNVSREPPSVGWVGLQINDDGLVGVFGSLVRE